MDPFRSGQFFGLFVLILRYQTWPLLAAVLTWPAF
jgi:hypothetical protein